MAVYCALTADQHKSLYKLIYKDILDKNDFDLEDFTKSLYEKVYAATKNHDLALTYASFVPSYAANMQTEDKDIRSIFKASKVDANDLLDKMDTWENNLQNVQSFIGKTTPEAPISTKEAPTPVQAKQITDDTLARANNRNDIEQIMKDKFNLPPMQAFAVASIYDRVNQTYEARTGHPLYQDVSFRKSSLADLGKDAQFQIIGEKGANNFQKESLDKLDQAKQLEAEGKSSQQIFAETGWEKGAEGKWKMDLPTDNIKMISSTKDNLSSVLTKAKEDGEYVNLSEILHYPELFKAYPELKDLGVTIDNDMNAQGQLGYGLENKDSRDLFPHLILNLDKIRNNDRVQKVLIHEVQHAIQEIEGFSASGVDSNKLLHSDDESAYNEYINSANEVEARNAAKRSEINDEEKEFAPISMSEDVARSNQLHIGKNLSSNYNILFQKGDITRAAVQIKEDGTAIIHALTDPNVSSPIHELAHVYEKQLTPEERSAILDWSGQQAIIDGGEGIWTNQTSELFARGFEKYLAEGEASDFKLQDIFDKFKQWLTDIYKGIFGSEIDLELNDPMRKIYSDMLGTDFRAKTLEEIRAENDTRTDAQKLVDQYKEESGQSKDFTTPIPPNSTNYWSHLSTIQDAFINNKYDQLLREGKIDQERLNDIITSTKSPENEGLSSDLVDQALFRTSHQNLIENKDYWTTFPDRASQDFDSYSRTVHEIVANGSLLDAINNNIISTEDASKILTHSGQIGIKEERAIKAKNKENEAIADKAKDIAEKAEDEQAPNLDLAPGVTQKDLDITKVRALAKDLPKSVYTTALANTTTDVEFRDVMKSLAEQLNDPGSHDATVKMLGDYISSVAQDMFPEARVEGADLLQLVEDGDTLSREDLSKIPNVDTIQTPIAEGDTVQFKGDNFTVNSIVYGETPEDNMYQLDNGSMKFGDQIKRVRSFDEQNVETFKDTAPEVFRTLEGTKNGEGELTHEDENVDALNYVGLKTLLNRLNNKFNGVIPYEVVSSPDEFIGRFNNGTVQINLRNFDKTTPFHEYLHPFVEVMKHDNPELYKNLAIELGNSEEGKKIIDEVKNSKFYKGQSAQDIGDEALVRYLAQKSAENVTSTGRRIETKYKSALERLVDKFRDWFQKLWRNGKSIIENYTDKNGKVVKQGLADIPVTASLQDVADMVSLHDVSIDLSSRINIFQNLDKYQAEDKETARTFEADMIDKIRKKLNVLEDTARNRISSDELLGEVIKLRGILKNPDEVFSLGEYMREGFTSLQRAASDFKNINNKLRQAKEDNVQLTPNDLLESAKQLEVVKNLIAFYSDAVQYFKYANDRMDKDEFFTYSKILNGQENILSNLRHTSVDLMTEWLYPYVERQNAKIKDKYPQYVLPKEKFKTSLYTAAADPDMAYSMLGSISSSKDAYSAVMRNALYSLEEKNHIFDAQLINTIKSEYGDFLNKTGIENGRKATIDYYKANYLRKATVRYTKELDAEKNPVYAWAQHWAFIQPHNTDLFEKARTEFIEDKANFPNGFYPGDDLTDEQQKKVTDKNTAILAKWEAENGNRVEVGTEKQAKDVFAPGDENNRFAKPIGTQWVDVPVTKLVPNDKYLNPAYEKLRTDPFYQELLKHYNEANDKLGESRLQHGIVPQVSKGRNLFADYYDKNPLEVVKTFGGKALDFFLAPKVEEDSNAKVLQNLDTSKYYPVKGYHNLLLEDPDLDLSLPETVLKFAGTANLNSLKSEIDPLVKIGKSLIEDNPVLKQEARSVILTNAKGETMWDRMNKRPALVEKARTRLNNQLVEFINDVMYGQSTIEANVNILGRTISLNKLGQNWSFLTALNNLAININAGINNVLLGKTQTFIEASGSRYFNLKNFAKGEGQYNSNFANFLKDPFRLQKSIITQLGIKYDAIQGEFRDKYGKRFVGNTMDRYASPDTLFILTHAGEHEIQLKGMLALMDATRVPLKAGGDVSLYDAHYVDKNGLLQMRDDVNWTQQQDEDFINQWHGINKRLNGNYSSFDKAAMQRRWYGQLALIYRKFIYSSIRSRFTKEYNDYELGNVDFGYQRKFFSKLASDVKDYKFEAARRLFTREGWSEDEKQAYNKTVSEFGVLAGTFVIAAAIGHAEAGTTKNQDQVAKALELYTLRFQNDVGMFTLMGLPDMVKIAQNPSAIMVTMKKYSDFFQQLATDPTGVYTQKQGIFSAGESKLKAKLLKALPISRQVINFMSPADQLAYYNAPQTKK